MNSTASISPQNLLNSEQAALLEAKCRRIRFPNGLSELPAVLQAHFTVELILDPDVVDGFATDSSNLPGLADALARPRSEFESAMIPRACHLAEISVTISREKSNLTGSATPEGGVLLSTVNLTDPAPEANEEQQTFRTAPSISLEELRKTVLREPGSRFCFPVDPTSQAEASIGGPFSSPDGQIEIDLIDLIVGAEGIYGRVSEPEQCHPNRPEAFFTNNKAGKFTDKNYEELTKYGCFRYV